MKLHEMQQKRDTIAREMRTLNDNAKTEKRAFTDEENTKWRDMTKSHDDLGSKIDREMQLRGMDEAAAGSHLAQDNQGQATEHATDRRSEIFTDYMRRGMAELSNEDRRELRALSTDVAGSGGVTVPTEFQSRIIESMKMYGGLANVCTILETSDGRDLTWAVSDGRTEVGEMLGENTAASESNPTTSDVTLGAYKGSSKIIKVSNELLQDSGVNIDDLIARRVGTRLGRLEAQQIMTGDNSTNNLNGIVNQVVLEQEAAAAAALVYKDLIELKHSVDPAYRMGGCGFMFNDNTFKGLKLLEDSEGRPLWLPSIAGVAPATIDGDTYTIDQAMSDVGASATSVMYGHWESVILRRVKYLAMRRLTERFAEYDQMGFLGFMRFDVLLEDVAAVAKLTHAAS